MKKLGKILCVLLAAVIAVLAGGCGYATDEEINSRLEGILENINSAFEDGVSKKPSSGSMPSEDILSTPESSADSTDTDSKPLPAPAVDEDGSYTSKEDVALYIYTYGKLPNNFITKKEAQALGWVNGSLEPYAKGKCIGGDYFGNYEGLLPAKGGRKYTECDIDTLGASSRGAKRIVFSNDGLIYYTEDHYATFTLLYGEE